jgi:hypothetical protein
MLRWLLVLVCLSWVCVAKAQPASDRVHAEYETYAVGVPVAEISSGFALGPRDYRIDLAYHTTGLVGMMFRGHQTTMVQGVWDGDRPAPTRFEGDGFWRGAWRQTVIDYHRGEPVVRSLIPSNEEEREPVPPALQKGAIDTLSAVALLMRRVARAGRCEAEATTFDGRRAVDVAAHTVGQEQLEPSGRSSFAGPALRCDFEGRLLAGFLHDSDQAELSRPQHGSAWFAPVVPGAPPIPVRISFETRWFGPATMYLTAAGPNVEPAR